MPVALGKLVQAFGLKTVEKPFFPHLANKLSNFGVRMKTLPPKEDYIADGMMPEVRAQFDEFYEKNFHTEFLLDEKLAEYCISDVGKPMNASNQNEQCSFRYTHTCSCGLS